APQPAAGTRPRPRSTPGGPQQPVGSLSVRAIRCFTIRATLPEPLAPLRDLMLNLRWSWHAGTRDLFTALDPAGRKEAGRDPITLLGEVSPERLARLATDEDYLGRLHRASADLREYLSAARWYQRSEQDGAAAGGRPPGSTEFCPGERAAPGPRAALRGPCAPGRGPPQGGQRPRRPADRGGAALPARLFQPVALAGRVAAGALPGRRPQRPAAYPAARPRRVPGHRGARTGRGQLAGGAGVAG